MKGHAQEDLVNEIVLRTQAQAEYTHENYGHFGLNLRRYAHFTSPIRRYADLVVHRALIRALGFGAGAMPETSASELAEIAARISAAERRAMAAERDTVDRLIAAHLADRLGAVFSARISGVTRSGLFVRLLETGADGFVPISTLGREYFVYDDARHALTAKGSGESYRLADPIEVRLMEVAPVAGALRFEPAQTQRASGSKRLSTPRPRSRRSELASRAEGEGRLRKARLSAHSEAGPFRRAKKCARQAPFSHEGASVGVHAGLKKISGAASSRGQILEVPGMPSYLDLAVLGIVLFSALLATLRGFTREVLAIAAWAGAAAVAYIEFKSPAFSWLHQALHHKRTSSRRRWTRRPCSSPRCS